MAAPEGIDTWAVLIAGGALLYVWFEHRFIPRSECKLQHSATEDRLDDGKKTFDEMDSEISRVSVEVSLLSRDVEWMIKAVHSIAEKVGANGFEPPPQRKRGGTPSPAVRPRKKDEQ